jgi:Protein of unknown function (DUF2442)
MILHVVRAEYRGGHRVHLWFNDQTDGEIDFQLLLDGPIFEPLKDEETFKKFSLEGHTIAWANGADFAPEYLHDLIQAQTMA